MNRACQEDRYSCGACCGIFNLKTDPKELLTERTERFSTVNVEVAPSVVAYRAEREEIERTIQRADPGVYVCPFLGFISAGRMGCLVHPARTGNPHSQNFSFYGASICQGYDCPAKEENPGGEYAALVSLCAESGEEYSRLVGDTLFFRAVARVPGFPGVTARPEFQSAFFELARRRLNTSASRAVTSFAVSSGRFASSLEEFRFLLESDFENLDADERARRDEWLRERLCKLGLQEKS